MKTIKPLYYVSRNGVDKFSYDEYCNHGKGGIYRGLMDLPSEGYPYSIEYETLNNPNPYKVFIETTAKYLNNDKREEPDEYDRRRAVAIAKWITGPVAAYLNTYKLNEEDISDLIDDCEFVKLIEITEFTNLLDMRSAIKVFHYLIENKYRTTAWEAIEKLGLLDDNSDNELESAITELLNEYPDHLARYRNGEKSMMGFFMGELRRKIKFSNGAEVNKLLNEKLK